MNTLYTRGFVRRFQRVFALAGRLLVILSLGWAGASQAATYGDFVYYLIDGTTVAITGYNCSAGGENVVVPDTIQQMPVVSIEDRVFFGCTSLTGVYFRAHAWPGIEVFYGADDVTVYYLAGTTGWDSTYADRPTALWIPVVPDLPSVTPGNPLRLVTHSPAPATVRVQRSVDLVNWEDWKTVSRDSGPSELQDTEASASPHRFYRGIEE